MNKTTIATIVGTVLTAIGSAATGANWTTGEEVTAIVGACVALIGGVTAVIAIVKRNTNKGGD
jgi:hypothetical protein